MRRENNLEEARQTGSLAAARELRRLKVDRRHSINIFNIIVEANLWLMFQPLEDLLGAYIQRSGGGILINSRRLRSVQRLTAAHEYGHHVLKHEGSLDDASDIDDYSAAKRYEEAAAQSFASDFLMPPELVNALWDELDIPDDLDAYHAYLLSLYMGTSYLATVYQLNSLGKIGKGKTLELLPRKPQEIKREIGRGVRPAHSWAEIWPIDVRQSGQTLEVSVEDELRLSLPEMPSTGFLWLPSGDDILDLREAEIVRSSDGELDAPQDNLFSSHAEEMAQDQANTALHMPVGNFGLIRSEFESRDASVLSAGTGGGGDRYMTFRALHRGTSDLRLCQRRPWQKGKPAAQDFSLHINIVGKPTGDADRGYLDTAKSRDLALTSTAT